MHLADVLRRYPTLGGATTIAPLPLGSSATSWLIRSPQGRFTLRRLPQDIGHERACLVASVQQHVALASGLAAQIIPNQDQQLITLHRAGAFTVAEHFDGSTGTTTVPDPDLCGQIGEAVGTIHRDLRSFPAQSLIAHPMRLSTRDPEAPLRRALSRHRSPKCTHPELRDALKAKFARASRLPRERLEAYDALPQSLIHGDVHLGNVVIRDRRVVGIIDFDLTRLAPPVYELMRGMLYCTRTNATAHMVDNRIRAFIAGYVSAAPLRTRDVDAMVGLFRTVQLLDVHGLDRCASAADDLLRFGYERFVLLEWLEQHGARITAMARGIARTD